MVKNASIVVSPDSGREFLLRIIHREASSADIRAYINKSLHLAILSLSTLGAISICCFFLASCATITEAERIERRYVREDRLILAREKFERARTACQSNGGSIMISRYSSGRLGKYTAHDYNMAKCVRF